MDEEQNISEERPLTDDDIVSIRPYSEEITDIPEEEPKVEETTATEPESATEPVVEPTTAVQTEPDDEPDNSEYLEFLRTETGLPFENIEDVNVRFKELLEEKQQLLEASKQFEGLSPRIKEAIKAEQIGLDPAQFFAISGVDTTKMDAKTALWQKYQIDNAVLLSKDPDYAKMRFEREFSGKYGVTPPKGLDEDELQEWERENADEIAFKKKDLEFAALEAKENIEGWKQKTLNPEKQEVQEQTVTYTKGVEDVMKEFEGIEIPFDDGAFKMSADPEVRSAVKQDLENPAMLIKEHLGIDWEKGTIDSQKLAYVSTVLNSIDKLGPLLKKYVLEQNAKSTIQGKMENPAKKGAPVNQNGGGYVDEWAEFADIVASRRR